MKTYVFVGVKASIPDADPSELTAFGQTVDIPDSRLPESLERGAQVIPKATFDALPFTTEEKSSPYFKSTELHPRLGVGFAEKRKAAWQALHDFRESILNPAVKEEVNHADVQ